MSRWIELDVYISAGETKKQFWNIDLVRTVKKGEYDGSSVLVFGKEHKIEISMSYAEALEMLRTDS